MTTPPRKTPAKPADDNRLSLAGMTPEEAIRRAFAAPAPKAPQTAPKKKRGGK